MPPTLANPHDAVLADARRAQKATYQAYQQAAQRLRHNPEFLAGSVQVSNHPEVQLVEGGAFVEATIWVPASEIATREGG